jgi:hypothetical protein
VHLVALQLFDLSGGLVTHARLKPGSLSKRGIDPRLPAVSCRLEPSHNLPINLWGQQLPRGSSIVVIRYRQRNRWRQARGTAFPLRNLWGDRLRVGAAEDRHPVAGLSIDYVWSVACRVSVDLHRRSRSGRRLPYSQFETGPKDGKIAEVAVPTISSRAATRSSKTSGRASSPHGPILIWPSSTCSTW